MGHKVHPTGFRLGFIKDWQSKWYSEAHYAEFVLEDNKLREKIKSKYLDAAISLVEIDRQAKDVTITLHTARPGIVILSVFSFSSCPILNLTDEAIATL